MLGLSLGKFDRFPEHPTESVKAIRLFVPGQFICVTFASWLRLDDIGLGDPKQSIEILLGIKGGFFVVCTDNELIVVGKIISHGVLLGMVFGSWTVNDSSE
jgi:hypothetical protein